MYVFITVFVSNKTRQVYLHTAKNTHYLQIKSRGKQQDFDNAFLTNDTFYVGQARAWMYVMIHDLKRSEKIIVNAKRLLRI